MKHAGTGDTCEKGKVMVFLRMSFRDLCIVTVSLPLISLLICFVTAYVFQYDDIHETHCRVYNIIPSISAVTGVSPQRYLWRISVALHMGPRIAIALVSKTFYDNLVINYKGQESSRAKILNTLCHWLNCIEIAALCGVTYISNRENYPLHEKIFIVFMICSLCHMLTEIKLRETVCEQTEDEQKSIKIKKILFYTSIITTVGLVVFFMKHRLLCHDMAFSWFALCEYVIAFANMVFHVTVIKDFPMEQLIVTQWDNSLDKEKNCKEQINHNSVKANIGKLN